ARRIAQRPEQIERSMNTELPPNARHTRRRTMKEWRKHETDPNLVERILRNQRYRRNIHTERRQQIRTARLTTRRTIPVLRDRQSRARNHKRRGSRDVESLRAT